MTVCEFYKKVEGDYDSIKQRLGSDEMILKFLGKFRKEQSYGKLMDAADTNDIENALLYAGQMHDVASTLSLDKLVAVIKELLIELRKERQDTIDIRLVRPITKEYQKTIKLIDKL